ncbi:MAG: nucleotide sugar dehydrogenase [Thermoproteota archaeon]|nr:MAG: nucleotide sugar dehydrogenase [Candidatus Korarchaeota archaeon]
MNLLKRTREELIAHLKDGRITVSIYGLGHVGVPLTIAWLLAGAKAIGVDIDEKKVVEINKGKSPVREPGADEFISRFVSEGKLIATTNGKEASLRSEVKLIAVPVGLDEKGRADLSALEAAAVSIGEGLKEGDLVILESSVPPGTTRDFLKPILEEISGLRAEQDFGLAYSPERIAEGRAIKDIVENYPKIVGGIGPKSSRVASVLYSVVSKKGVILMDNAVAAELEKLVEGIYRDVNIALANEIAKVCRAIGLDFEEIRVATNSQPYCHLHRAGPGVGGYCIPIYPYFVMSAAKEYGVELKLTKIGREINENMPKEVVRLILDGLNKFGLKKEVARITLLGLAFRGDVPDARLSPTYDIIKELLKRGFYGIMVHDPYIEHDEELLKSGVKLTQNLEEAMDGTDIVVILTDHSDYKRLSVSKLRGLSGKPIVIIDGRNMLKVDMQVGDSLYVGIGRPWISI